MRALGLLLLLVGCGTPEVPSLGDASTAPLPREEAETLATVFLDARDARGTESCRCAGDVPFCKAETFPDLTPEQRACVIDRIEVGGDGMRFAIPCLAAAAEAFVQCGAPHACPDVESRMACKEAYEADGAACFAEDAALAGLLSACLPDA